LKKPDRDYTGRGEKGCKGGKKVRGFTKNILKRGVFNSDAVLHFRFRKKHRGVNKPGKEVERGYLGRCVKERFGPVLNLPRDGGGGGHALREASKSLRGLHETWGKDSQGTYCGDLNPLLGPRKKKGPGAKGRRGGPAGGES